MKGFIHILSNIQISDYHKGIELVKNNIFRKATPKEILLIKNELKKIPILHGIEDNDRKFIYEYESGKVKTDEYTTYEKINLNEDDFKYWIIEFDNNHQVQFLELAINLINNSFELGFTFIYSDTNQEKVSIMYSDYIINKYKNMECNYYNYKTTAVDIDEIISIQKIYKRLMENSEKELFIKYSIDNFNSLKYIDDNSNLLFVGYFSIIESLVTHSPRLKESLDSISHQIVNKLNLLQKFFLRQVDYNKYFNSLGQDKVWSKLYSYRSDIAHGNPISFEKEAKYKALKSKKNIKLFLEEIIKNLILVAINNPELLCDLKKC